MNKDLLVNYLLSEVNEDEKSLVEEWLEKDPKNRQEFLELKKVWEMSKEDKHIVPEVDVDNAWITFLKLKAEKEEILTAKQLWSWKKIIAIAASISIFFALTWTWYLYTSNSSHLEVTSGLAYKQALLPDGSTVNLNKNASLSFDKQWLIKKRNVVLKQGEVFFDVKRNEKEPFVISSGKSTITVLGTSFHVSRSKNMTEVIVASGSVKINYNDNEVVLKPQQSVKIEDNNNTLVKIDTVPDKLYSYYVHQEFIFENTPLKRVFEVLSKAYNQKIIIDDPNKENLLYTSTFKQQNLQEMMEVILQTFDLYLEKKNNTYHIK